MFPVSRRILAYWLLLLIPALGVGLGAIMLLRREQARLAERAAYADEARRAAVTARARLIAENAELLVGDVQSGLLDLLAAEPAGGIDRLLDQLEKTNPLVRTGFQCAPDGRVLRPAPDRADDDGRGFLRRFAARLRESPPWRNDNGGATIPSRTASAPAAASLLDEVAQKKESYDSSSRQQVASNVSKVQSARRDVQALAKNIYPEAARTESSAPALVRGYTGVTSEQRSPSLAAAASPGRPEADIKDFRPPARTNLDSGLDTGRAREQRGWFPVKVDGRLHLLGWVQPAGADGVRGVELEMAALISRLGGALPAEISGEEGYALRDDQGRVLHQAGAVPRAAIAAVTVPLAAELLPGWTVVAFVPEVAGDGAGSGGFFLISTLLVGIFVAAIVAGGSLLLWQARRSEAEAAQKTSFVANVSHEFKTPLTTIRLYSELLEQGRVRDAAQSGEYLRTIGRETQRLARLVGNALDFSRLEQGQKKYARDNLDLRAELTRLLDTQAPRLTEAGLVLHRGLPAQPLPVTSDRDAFEQIVLNLLDNAAKYGAAGGEVTVELASGQAGGAEIRVLDRGPGVPPTHRERIFEKFHRVDDTLTAEKAGAGLGLSIARQLARGLGGELRHLPRAGGGASFILELP
ncbi:MAG: HAMP domain-containing sensor histidine kinase [Lacunisphaera sp.]|nr:HAMP domain-containing sensor histidine kinase [Lacunisphaera sp.]